MEGKGQRKKKIDLPELAAETGKQSKRRSSKLDEPQRPANRNGEVVFEEATEKTNRN